MRILAIIVCGLLVLSSAGAQESSPTPSPSPSPEPPPPSVALRAKLMDLGGALSNEGYKMRDRLWSGRLETREPQRLAVNLFRGNHYWFCLAVDPETKKPAVALFDREGRPVEAQTYADAGVAAVGVTAESTGQYFVQIETAGGPASDFCLLYLFK